jgi:thioredoxin 1
MLAPTVSQLAEAHPEIKVGKVNIDDEQQLAAMFNIMSIPTLILFNNGQPVKQTVGVQPLTTLEEFIKI